MKISENFIMREIAGECILIPIGSAAADFNGLISLNEVGKFVVELLSQERTVDEIVEHITQEYDVPWEDALTDVEAFLQQLRQINALVEA